MTKPYVVFVFDTDKPLGGWDDVLKKDDEVLFFTTGREAADAGRAYWKANFPNSGKFQVIDVQSGKLEGTGGHKTGRKPA